MRLEKIFKYYIVCFLTNNPGCGGVFQIHKIHVNLRPIFRNRIPGIRHPLRNSCYSCDLVLLSGLWVEILNKKILKICVYLRPNPGFGILGLGLKKQTKIGCVGWLSALGVLCVRIICWVGSGFKQQKTLCLRGLCVRKMVVWDEL